MVESQAKNSLPQPRRRAISGAEVILLILVVIVGMGMWIWVEREFNEFFYSWEPNKEAILKNAGAEKAQAELTQLQTDAAEIQKQLSDAKLDELKQQTTVTVLEQRHPGLRQIRGTAVAPDPEQVKQYDAATTQLLIARSLARALNDQSVQLSQQVSTNSDRLVVLKANADSEFHRKNARYIIIKPLVTLGITLLTAFLVLLFVKTLMRFIPKKSRAEKREFSPMMLVVAVLLILFAYQAFQLAGAAIIAILFMSYILFKINWPDSTQPDSVPK